MTIDKSKIQLRDFDESAIAMKPYEHIYADNIRCRTDKRGHATPNGKSHEKIRVQAEHGYIPLWERWTILRYRFDERSMQSFQHPERAKEYFRDLLNKAVNAWGDATPIRFTERPDAADFEIVVQPYDDCNATGCVLASAFFPSSEKEKLVIYPQMLEQNLEGQIRTMAHELGHVFGLRHFFANISEKYAASEVFGFDSKFSIMNYGQNSFLTDADRNDLRCLYKAAWSRQLTHINGTPIRLITPRSTNILNVA